MRIPSHQGYPRPPKHRDPSERVAYWYFRLNGFLQIENFVLHPDRRRDGQRTDGDLLGVRFRNREEFAFNIGSNIMIDDVRSLGLSRSFDDVVIVDVTTQPCKLNDTWTSPDRTNVQRFLAAIGCLPCKEIAGAASLIYERGAATWEQTRIRLVAIGREHNSDLQQRYPEMLQLTWNDVLGFIWDRFDRYRNQKHDVSQWDDWGKWLWHLANMVQRDEFLEAVKCAIGISKRV